MECLPWGLHIPSPGCRERWVLVHGDRVLGKSPAERRAAAGHDSGMEPMDPGDAAPDEEEDAKARSNSRAGASSPNPLQSPSSCGRSPNGHSTTPLS